MNLRCVEDKLTFCFDVGTREDLFNRERKGKDLSFSVCWEHNEAEAAGGSKS